MPHPLGHITGTFILIFQIIINSQNILFADISDELIFKSIEKYRINVLPAFPHFGHKLIDDKTADRYDLTSLMALTTGGSAFPAHIAQAIIAKYGLKFREVYSMTEYILITRGSNLEDDYIPGNLGRVSSGTEVKIVDLTTGVSLGAGIDGEICVRGNKLFSGYLNNAGATRDSFDGEGWFRTGDIGHYDAKERLFITDRLKEMINVSVDKHFFHLSPVAVEQYLLTHGSIAEVVVVGVNNSAGNQWPRAYVVLNEGQTISAEEIQNYVSGTLSVVKHLKAGVFFVDCIQRTSIGKVDRKYYRNLVKDEVVE